MGLGFDFRQELFGPWPVAQGYLVEQFDRLYATLQAFQVLLTPIVPALWRVLDTSGPYTTASGAFAQIPNASITLTTNARSVLITFTGTVKHDTLSGAIDIDLLIDGVSQTLSNGLVSGWRWEAAKAATKGIVTIAYQSATLLAGAHTFTVAWRVNMGTGTLTAGAGDPPYIFSVQELGA